MEMNVGIIAAVVLFLVIMLLQSVEQRRTASAYRKALADSADRANATLELGRHYVEQQRESNRLLTLIAQKLDAQQK
jgi:hypothetical protein